MKNNWLLCITFIISITASLAQQGNTSTLTIKKIMQGDDFVGHLPSDPQWSTDGQTLYFN